MTVIIATFCWYNIRRTFPSSIYTRCYGRRLPYLSFCFSSFSRFRYHIISLSFVMFIPLLAYPGFYCIYIYACFSFVFSSQKQNREGLEGTSLLTLVLMPQLTPNHPTFEQIVYCTCPLLTKLNANV